MVGKRVWRVAGVIMALGSFATAGPGRARAANGTWKTVGSGLWSAQGNWNNNTVADGAGNTAYFNAVNLAADATIHLDSARSIGNVIFGDTNTSTAAGWTLDNNGSSSNILTLAGATPTITVNTLGTNKVATISAAISGTAGLTKEGSGTLTLSGNNTYTGATVLSAGTLVLNGSNTYSDGTTISNGAINVGNVAALGRGAVNVNSGGTLNLASFNIANAIVLNGGTLGFGGNTPSVYSAPITLNNLAGNTFNVDRNYHTLSGRISGAGGVTLTGSNTPGLILSNTDNDFQGGVTINSGAFLRLDASEVLPNTTIVTVNGTLRMDTAGGTETIGGLSGTTGEIWLPTSNPGGFTLVVGAGGASSSYGGAIGKTVQNSNISLVKTGAGTLTLTGANLHTGGITVSQGTLQAGSITALGTATATLNDANTAASDTSLVASAAVTIANDITVANQGTGTTTLGSTSALTGNAQFGGTLTLGRDVTLQAGSSDRTTFTGQITGTGNVTISSPFVAGRRVVFRRSSGNANNFIGNLYLAANGKLQLGVNDSIGNRTVPDSSNVYFASGSQLLFAPLASGDGETVGALVSQAVGAGTLDMYTDNTSAFTLTIGSNGVSGTFSGVIQNTTGSIALVKTGTGTLTLAGANTYKGGTTLSQGILQVGNAGALGTGGVTINDSGTGIGNTSLLATAAVTINNSIAVANQGSGTTTLGTADFDPGANNTQFGGTLTLNKAVTLQAGSADRTTFAGQITGTGNVTIASPFAANRRICFDRPSGSANNFEGDIHLDANATLQLGAMNAIGNRTIPDGSSVCFAAGSQLNFAPLGADSETLGALVSQTEGAGTIDVVTSSETFTLTIGAGDASGVFSGVIQNSGSLQDTTPTLSLVKTGAGMLTLSGTNTYTGATAVNNGTLKIRAGGSLGNTAITVASGATLAAEPGTAAINLGDASQSNTGATVALNAGSIFDMTADADAGIVNLQQHAGVLIGLTIGEAAGSPVQFHFDLGGTSATAADLLNVASGVSMPGSAVISISLATGTTSLTPGDYPLIKSPAGGLGSGFTLASSTITVNDVPYTLSLVHSTAYAEILTVASSLPANAVWSSLADGSTLWSEPGNWNGSGRLPPNGAKAQVTFGDAGKQGTVDLGGGTWTVGRITFNGYTGTTLASATSLVLDNGGVETAATVAVNHAEGVSQTHAINVPLLLKSDLSVTVADSHDQLTLGGRIQSVDGARTLTLNGSGKLVLSGGDNNYGDTVVAGGTLEILAANALPPGQDLTIGASGTVVLSSNLSAAATAASHGSTAAVPEPCTLMQLAAGLLAVLAAAAWRWGERITSGVRLTCLR